MWQNRLISKKNHHWRDVAISVRFYALLGLLGGFAEWKKGMHFGAQVWISMPFLGLSGGLRRGKRARILEQECGFLCPFWASWGRTRRGKRASSSRFQDGDEGLSSANGVFLVSEGLRPMLGPCWATKIPKRKNKSVGHLCLGILRR